MFVSFERKGAVLRKEKRVLFLKNNYTFLKSTNVRQHNDIRKHTQHGAAKKEEKKTKKRRMKRSSSGPIRS